MNDVLLVGPTPDLAFTDDGCSGGAPDKLFGVTITPACRVHDWEYHLGRIKDQIIQGDWMYNGVEYTRNHNGLVHLVKLVANNKQRATYKTALFRFKKLRATDRRVADRQLCENIKRLAEDAYNRGDIGYVKLVTLRAAGGRYLGAVKRWGWAAIQGPGRVENFVDLTLRTRAFRAKVEEEWRKSYDRA